MKLILVCGARPNFIKVAPIVEAIEKRNKTASTPSPATIEYLLVHTGQHYDYEMSQIFFDDLQLPKPDIYLGIGSGTHAEQTGKIMIEFEKALVNNRPDLVIVVGDVNSTLAAAFAAVKLHIPVAHIEAGLRSYDMTMPEEINRVLTDHISDYLFTTSKYDDANLKREGIPKEKKFCVGNIMVDSLLEHKEAASQRKVPHKLGLENEGYALLTLHRPNNVDQKDTLMNIMSAIEKISQRIPVIFPAHPRTQKTLKQSSQDMQPLIADNKLLITPPVGYLDFVNLEMNSRFIITDSGGIQVESTVLGIPCLTILDTPVWTITHQKGTNTLVGSNIHKLIEEASKILDGRKKKGKCPELWDGKTADRIIDILLKQPL